MIAGHDVLIVGLGVLLIYADLGWYYIINDRSLRGYLSSWKRDIRKLVS